jgi:O-methyltransferase involved in polyketide biosynthesis
VTFFLAEGLTMYLTDERVRELLGTFADRASPGSRIAWTFMEPREDGEVAFRGSGRGLDAWLSNRREPFTWGIPREAVAGLVAPMGLEVIDMAGEKEFRSRYLRGHMGGAALAAGEIACVLRKL